jgi:AcrR family transcriptional regulator
MDGAIRADTLIPARTKIEPRPRGRPRSEQARQEILETAYKLMRDKGFNVVGSHEIAQVAGVSSATLYRWWKSKEEILFPVRRVL